MRPLLLTALLLLGDLAPALAQTATTPAESARAMLRQYQEDPARIDRARESQVRQQLVKSFVAQQALGHDMAAVIRRRLRIDQSGGLKEPALRERLRR